MACRGSYYKIIGNNPQNKVKGDNYNAKENKYNVN